MSKKIYHNNGIWSKKNKKHHFVVELSKPDFDYRLLIVESWNNHGKVRVENKINFL